MPSFAELIQQSTAHAWLFIPSAVLLGALHGLEPGHSKTMMAAFIVAIRGTVAQAIMLGLAATVSHTIVVWGIAIGGLYLWQGVQAETFEPYFQLLSAAIIIGIALWMLWRTWSDQRQTTKAEHDGQYHDHDHHHDDGHHHDEHHHRSHDIHAVREHEDIKHGLVVATDGYQDVHELAHAEDIRRRFSSRNVTTWQIIVFGLTGGLIPCPAAITVLLLCLQLKQFTLGFTLVLCFSIGLAITLTSVGAIAAFGVRHATQRLSWFSTLARRAPYVSSILIIGVGFYIAYHGYAGLLALN